MIWRCLSILQICHLLGSSGVKRKFTGIADKNDSQVQDNIVQSGHSLGLNDFEACDSIFK